MLERLKKFSWGYVLIGVLLLAVGICFISMQDAFTTLAITMGIILAVVGIGFLVNAFVCKGRGVLFGLKIAFSVICIVCGVVTALTQDSAILVIANIFFLLLIIDGAFKLQLAIMSRRYSFFGWWIILSVSVTVIICSFLLCKFTPENPTTLTVLSGILFAVDGVNNLLASFWSSALTRRIDEGDEAIKGKSEGEGTTKGAEVTEATEEKADAVEAVAKTVVEVTDDPE